MPELASLPALAAPAAATLADLALKGTVVLLAAFLVAALLRRASASTRHLAWTAAFVALLALPLLAALLPAWRVPLLHRGWPAARAMADVPPVSEVVFAPPLEMAPVGPPPPHLDAIALAPPPLPDHIVFVRPEAGPAFTMVPTMAPVEFHGLSTVFARLGGAATLALWIWLAGVELVLLWLGVGAFHLRRMGRRARSVNDGPAAALLPRLMARAGVYRPVWLLEGDDTAMPLTWGVLRPRILLPAAHRAWPADRLEAVLLHELAHVRRHDCLTQLLAGAACALHWFNPLAWMAMGRLRLEAEHACDDGVLATGAPPSDYAAHLLDVARTLSTPRPITLTGVAMARPSQLRTRLLAVLSSERRRGGVPPAAVAGALAGAALIAIPLAALTPSARGEAVRTVRLGPVVIAPMYEVGPLEELVTVAPVISVDEETIRVTERSVHLDTVMVPAIERIADAVVVPTTASPARMEKVTLIPTRVRAPRAASAVPCRTGGRSTTSRRDETDGRVWNVAWRRGACVGSARIDGRVAFDGARGDVAAVGRGGTFRLELRSAAGTGRVEIHPRRDGTLERRWWRDGRPQPWGPEARAWLADALPELLRHTQYDEELRR